MIKEYTTLSKIRKLPLLSNQGESSLVYKDNDTVIKVYNSLILELEKNIGLDTEKKILTAEPIAELPEITVPTSAIYDKKSNKFIASRIPYIDGVDYKHVDTTTTTDLKTLCNTHIRLENFLQKADKYRIVLPDYATLDNLIIDGDGNFHFIDYDGLVIKENKSFSVSSSIQTPLINTPKYYKDGFFTQELNIFSHYVVFFLDVVHANLTKIGQETPNGRITFDDFFECIGLEDYDIQNKIWKLFQPNRKNEYLGEDLVHLQENYNLQILGTYNGYTMKRLIKK